MESLDSSTETSPRTRAAVAIGLGLWFLIALAAAGSGVLYRAPVPVIGATNASLVVLTLTAVFLVRPLRAWAMHVSLRWLVLYHTVRFVGIAFLVLHARGALPAAFAVPAGWGDIAVAASALVVAVAACPATTPRRRVVLWVWNLLGLADILLVVSTAMRLGMADIDQMAAITAFPFSLLPTFIVPLIIATHVVMLVRLGRRTPHVHYERA